MSRCEYDIDIQEKRDIADISDIEANRRSLSQVLRVYFNYTTAISCCVDSSIAYTDKGPLLTRAESAMEKNRSNAQII